MRSKFSNWQIAALFIPFYIAVVLNIGPQYFGKGALVIANILLVFNILIAHAYQVYFAYRYNEKLESPSMIFRFHILLPLIGLMLYFLDVVRGSIFHADKINFGPIKQLQFNWYMNILYFILIYAGVNFFFLNSYIVSKQIGSVDNTDLKSERTALYLQPMKQVTRISLWSLLVGFSVAVIIEIVFFTTVSK